MKSFSTVERICIGTLAAVACFVFGYMASGPSHAQQELLDKISEQQKLIKRLTDENISLNQTIGSQQSDLLELRNKPPVIKTVIEEKKSDAKQNVRQSAAPREVVENSLWDGSVSQVESYLRNTLNDWGSYKSVKWYKVVKENDGSFKVRHTFRAKNAFGGYILQDMVFALDSSGNVTAAL